MSSKKIPITCLLGPTASGKTAKAIEMVQAGGYEIISVDSAMIYRGMDIGTAKPSAEELALAPHRLIDICDPSESYSVGDFIRDVQKEIEAIVENGSTPLLVGGTMMYFNALQHGLSQLPTTTSEVRERVGYEVDEIGLPAAYKKIQILDAASAEKIMPSDRQRIQRVLEVYAMTGETMSALQKKSQYDCPYHFTNIILNLERSVLHERIEKRFDKMLEQGFVEEVEALKSRGDLHLDLPSMRCVGYRQVWEHLDGLYDYVTMRDRAIAATRQLCKRQATWLRNKWGIA